MHSASQHADDPGYWQRYRTSKPESVESVHFKIARAKQLYLGLKSHLGGYFNAPHT